MGGLTTASAIVGIANSPLSTGNPVGDATSYGALGVILAIGWKLFRWWRADVADVAGHHADEIGRYERNQLVLLAHITTLSILLASAGGDVPDPPKLEQRESVRS